ncbi:DUF2891 domain-containing protein [Streptomyces sp. 8N114]|uniref:DUF2891 domain-containing protein n=1 Tax=Streptomyces sp. 8N114 TaxID=3457419 RepID=UPI003FD20620
MSLLALTERAARFAEVALANITREYPNAPAHLLAGPAELVPPRVLHPAFYGAYDWHSSVHMHWLLLRLLRIPWRGELREGEPREGERWEGERWEGELREGQPREGERERELREGRTAVVRTLHSHLTPEALATETAYLRAHPFFERPYGWAWLLALTSESSALLSEHEGAAYGEGKGAALGGESSALLSEQAAKGAALAGESGAPIPEHAATGVAPAVESGALEMVRQWRAALAPAAEAVTELVLAWLPKATYPVRHGTHANSAFALGVFLDSAERAGQQRLVGPVVAKIHEWYVPDHGAATRWEPSGQDFLSPLLCEADAVRRVLPQGEFAEWLERFLPELDGTGGPEFLPPPRVSDPADPQLGHLLGLCLSRAAALRGIAGALPSDDPRVATLTTAAEANLAAGLPATTSGDFTTDHWLATFATLALGGGVAA